MTSVGSGLAATAAAPGPRAVSEARPADRPRTSRQKALRGHEARLQSSPIREVSAPNQAGEWRFPAAAARETLTRVRDRTRSAPSFRRAPRRGPKPMTPAHPGRTRSTETAVDRSGATRGPQVAVDAFYMFDVVRPAAALRGDPVDVLVRVLDVAGLAVDAVLGVDLEARAAFLASTHS